MRRRQTMPHRWLIVRGPDDREGIVTALKLPRGAGVLLLGTLSAEDMRRLRRRRLTVVHERRGSAERVHDLRQLRRALIARTPLILLSPMWPTSSHPSWKPIPRMRAGTLARLAGRKLIALGGMDAHRFARIERLGFQAWAGISAFRT